MLKLINKMLHSRTLWTLVFMVVTNVVGTMSGVLSPDLLVLVNTVLAALAAYFRINTSVKF